MLTCKISPLGHWVLFRVKQELLKVQNFLEIADSLGRFRSLLYDTPPVYPFIKYRLPFRHLSSMFISNIGFLGFLYSLLGFNKLPSSCAGVVGFFLLGWSIL